MRKAHAGLGALRLGSILPRSEKVNLTHLAKGSVRRTMSRPDAILLKWIKSAVILHLYILRLYCTCQGECTHLCIYWDDMGVFFLKNWLFTDSRCPPPSVPPSPSLISASPAVRSTWPPGKREEEKKTNKTHQQACREPPITATELFRVSLTQLGKGKHPLTGWWSSVPQCQLRSGWNHGT